VKRVWLDHSETEIYSQKYGFIFTLIVLCIDSEMVTTISEQSKQLQSHTTWLGIDRRGLRKKAKVHDD
jgi:hypothetical protein